MLAKQGKAVREGEKIQLYPVAAALELGVSRGKSTS